MKSKHSRSRLVTGLLAGLLVCAVGVGGTVAWLHDSAKVTNTFDMAEVKGSISEDFDDKTVKESISVHNNGDIDAYVRVALSACWMDGEGNIAPLKAELAQLSDLEEGSDWFEDGGYYYYRGKVSPGDNATWDLNAQPTETNAEQAESGWHFRVDVSAQLIQADPPEAVEDSWNVTVTNGSLSPETP